MRPPDWGQPLSGARGLLAVVVDCVLLVQRGQRLGLLVGHVAGAALGACSWIMWRGQRLGPARGSCGGGSAWGLLVGVLAVVTPMCAFGVHVGVSCSLRVCVQGRELCGGPAPPLCAPSNGALPLAGPGFFPVHPQWP